MQPLDYAVVRDVIWGRRQGKPMSFTKPGPNAGAAPDCLQRPLRSRFRQQVSASVRLPDKADSVLHVMH
jgi:hypothetical protein